MKRRADAYDTSTGVFSVNNRESKVAVPQSTAIHIIQAFGDIVYCGEDCNCIVQYHSTIMIMYECYCGSDCATKSNVFLWVYPSMSMHMMLINIG